MYGPVVLYRVSANHGRTGRCEARVSLLGGENNPIYFHQKKGKNQGLMSKDWPGVRKRLSDAIMTLDGGEPNLGAAFSGASFVTVGSLLLLTVTVMF